MSLVRLSISPYITGFFELLFTPVITYLSKIFYPKGFLLPLYSSVDYAKLRSRNLSLSSNSTLTVDSIKHKIWT